MALSGITSTTALWYASRATGVVALVLLTGVMVLGVTVQASGRLPGLPRFGVTGLHKNLSLLGLAFVAVHVITAVADPFVTIGLAATVIPFVSPYEPVWLGLGAVSLDLMIALIATSLVRVALSRVRWLGRRTWRAVHWLAYLTWPVAFAHSIGSARDLQSGWLLVITIGCGLAVTIAVLWRLIRAATAIPASQHAAQLLVGVEPASSRAELTTRGGAR